MQKKVLKLGLAGCARGLSVVSEVVGDRNAVIRAVADIKADRLQEAKEKLEAAGVRDLLCFESLEEMLHSDIDAVFIATDMPLHTKHVIMALEAGKHVLSEIPAVHSLEEAKALRAAVKAHPELVYMCGENCCYWAFIDSWKKMREQGKFGDIVYAESEYLHADPIDKLEPPVSPDHWRVYNPAIVYLTHNLGPLLYIMNDCVVSVTCMTPDIPYNPYRKAPCLGAALFKTEKGAVIRILINFGSYVGFDHNFALYGTHGSILTDKTKSVEDAHSFLKCEDIPGSIDAPVEIPVATRYPGESDGGHGGCDRKMMRDFIGCVLEGRQPELDVDFAIRISLPGIYAHESSLRGGEPVEIPVVE